MKVNEDDVIYLSNKTSFSRHKCEKVLLEFDGDVAEACQYLTMLRENTTEVLLDNITAYFTGERGWKAVIYDEDKVIVSLPAAIPVLCLLFLDIPSWVLAALLLLIIAFNMDLKFEGISRRDRAKVKAIHVEDYKRKKQQEQANKVKNRENSVKQDGRDDDYNEITIE